jgi:hypothetical protein
LTTSSWGEKGGIPITVLKTHYWGSLMKILMAYTG